jgi:hypothetical protein
VINHESKIIILKMIAAYEFVVEVAAQYIARVRTARRTK